MKDTYFHETSNHEWLLTNKIGGYALGTGNLINQRKYHGLLIAGDKNRNRNHLVAGMEILLEWRGETCYLDSTNYSSCIYPEGFLHLVKSWLRPYPIHLYSSLHHNNDILVRQEIMMADRENTVLIKITNLGHNSLNFLIRPKLTLRNHHETNPAGYWDNRNIDLQCNEQNFHARNNSLSLYGLVQNGNIQPEKVVYRDCYYPWEAIRGYQGVEDQLAPVKISFSLLPGETNYILFTDDELNLENTGLSGKIAKIERKYRSLPLPVDYPAGNSSDNSLLEKLDYEDRIMFDYNDYLSILEFSLLDFLIDDDVVAGYPWFGCWGRDTFIYLEALLNAEVSHRKCWKIIKSYASLLRNGLIPNMLTESSRELNYHSIDSTLWFVLRIYDLVNRVVNHKLYGYKTITGEAIEIIEQVLTGLIEKRDNLFDIAENGLLYLTEEFATATWMDARVDEKGVTPRTGAPVEVNALFYNALCCYSELHNLHQKSTSSEDGLIDKVTELKEKIKKSFSLFKIDGYLADRLEGEEPVREFRPNAIIATSLPFKLLSEEEIRVIFHTAERELATPYGLRTLSPSDYRFKKKYLGNQKERDAQYHQGTVWAWLLDPYVKTYYNSYKNTKSFAELQEEITKIINNLRQGYMKGHISSVAEVWDGLKPHFPKGCPAQAWSVAALYNIETLLTKLDSESEE